MKDQYKEADDRFDKEVGRFICDCGNLPDECPRKEVVFKHFHSELEKVRQETIEECIKRVKSMKPSIGEGYFELGVVSEEDMIEVGKYNKGINEVVEVLEALSINKK